MLRQYWKWWVDQMLALVPERARLAMVETQECLLVEPEVDGAGGAALRLSRLRRREVEEIGRFPLDATVLQGVAADRRGPVHLRLPASQLLEKRLSLPIAAARDLDRVLAYEMDRETPFAVDDVWWSFAVEQRDRQHGKVIVRLSLVPKVAVEALLAVLRQARLAPALLDIVGSPGDAHTQIPIDAPRRHDGLARNRLVPIAAIACGVLAVIAAGLPFVRLSWEIGSLEARMAALKPGVDEADRLRRQIDAGAGADVLAAEQARLGDPLVVLAAATAIMPDDTHLTDFTMEQRKVLLNGQSVGAAKLIAALTTDPTFKDPAFAAPSTHMDGARTETFSIGAEARP